MATNMRAYRDGNRMVLVIENPTQDLENLVAAMLTGEISSVKGLNEPKPMPKPKLDVKQMEEIKPVSRPNQTPTASVENAARQEEPRKAQFVKNLEAARMAPVSTETPSVGTMNREPSNTASVIKPVNNSERNPVANTAGNQKEGIKENTDTVKAETTVQPATVSTPNVKPAETVTEPVKKAAEAAKPAQINLSRAAMIRMVKARKDAPIVRLNLKDKYHNPDYPIEKLNDTELKQLVAALSRS